MKILLVSFYYYPELGAAPSRITNMAEGFLKYHFGKKRHPANIGTVA